MDENYKRQIILDNYQNPYNRGLVKNDNYKIIKLNSITCIDQIDLQIKLNNDIIEDIRFDGEACAICTSSTSILIKNIVGKNITEAISFINNYNNMIDEKKYNKSELNEAIVYENISAHPNRKKCATLTYDGLKKFLESEDKSE